MTLTMSWQPFSASPSPQVRGLETQWRVMFGTPMPELLTMIASAGPGRAHWAVALIKARAIAGDDPKSRALLGRFEMELATALGVATMRWPRRQRSITAPTAMAMDLPALDPSQQLMLALDPTATPTRDHAVISTLVSAAFAPREESPHAAELRARVCSLAVTPPARERWRSGFGLMPPDDVAPGEHHGAMRLLQRAFADDGTVAAVAPSMCAPMRPEAALDVLLCGLSVRAGLRRAGVMRDEDATVTMRIAA
jgi:hypothetical protein